MRALFLAFVVFALIGTVAERASAQLSPGELSRVHAEIDSSRDCLQCHATGKGVTRERCLSCHGLLGERIEAGAGLHARPDYQRCETCHIEHHGREFELIWWGKAGIEGPPGGWQMEHFDHDETGYPLTGPHRLGCRECHQASRIAEPERLVAAGKDLDRTFLGLGTRCVTCHQDPHRGQMAPRECSECHGDDAWLPASGFDHVRTDFPLDRRHLRVDCADCHATETDDAGSDPSPRGDRGGEYIRYGGTATACADCHQDPHRGRLGRDCAACHTTADWQKVDRARFNHDLTRFPLRGLHTRVDCAGCHRDAGSFRISGFDDCASCHADVHVGQFRVRAGLSPGDGGACSDCHDVNGFKPSRFDLADHAETRFPLDGAHREVPCVSCHEQVATADLVARGVAAAFAGAPATAQVFAIEATGCADCHRDPHAGTADAYLGDAGCKTCHDSNDWHSASQAPAPGVVVSFDHDATGFSLEGAHRTVGCAECHRVTGRGTDEIMLSFDGAPTACRGCHDDPHLGQFDLDLADRSGRRPEALAACRDCHSLEGWTPSIFDHNTDSAFPLEGKHALAECGACHVPEIVEGREMVRYKPLPTACSGCHRTPADTPATEPPHPNPLPQRGEGTRPEAGGSG